PIVARQEIAARIADDGGAELLGQLQHVATEAVLVGGLMARLIDAAIDAAAHMLDEGAEHAPVEIGDDEVAVDDEFGVQHGSKALGLIFGWLWRGPPPAGAGRRRWNVPLALDAGGQHDR